MRTLLLIMLSMLTLFGCSNTTGDIEKLGVIKRIQNKEEESLLTAAGLHYYSMFEVKIPKANQDITADIWVERYSNGEFKQKIFSKNDIPEFEARR